MSEELFGTSEDSWLAFSHLDDRNSVLSLSAMSDKSRLEEDPSSSPSHLSSSEQDLWLFEELGASGMCSAGESFLSADWQPVVDNPDNLIAPLPSSVLDTCPSVASAPRFDAELEDSCPEQEEEDREDNDILPVSSMTLSQKPSSSHLESDQEEVDEPLSLPPTKQTKQLVLPKCGQHNREEEKRRIGELVFQPESISETEFDQILSLMKEKGLKDKDKDRVFGELHRNNYDTEKVLPLLDQPSKSEWNEIEKTLFEKCMEHSKLCPKWVPSWQCGNVLHEILYPRRDWSGAERLLKTKTRQQICEYYWKWLKSNRRRRWLRNTSSSVLQDPTIRQELETKLNAEKERKRKRSELESVQLAQPSPPSVTPPSSLLNDQEDSYLTTITPEETLLALDSLGTKTFSPPPSPSFKRMRPNDPIFDFDITRTTT